MREAVQWLSYTYMHTRMAQNPLAYGFTWNDLAADPTMDGHRRALIVDAANELERSKMARFDQRSGQLCVLSLSHPT